MGVLEPILSEPCLSFRLSGMPIRGVPDLQWYASKSCGFSTNKWACVSYFETCPQYRLVCFDCKMGCVNIQCWICHDDMHRILRHKRSSTIAQQLPQLFHKYLDTGTQYCLVFFHWRKRLVNKLCLICDEDMRWNLRCTGESWAHIVMINQSLLICQFYFASRQLKRFWVPVSGYLWHSHSLRSPMVEVTLHLKLDHMRSEAPA